MDTAVPYITNPDCSAFARPEKVLSAPNDERGTSDGEFLWRLQRVDDDGKVRELVLDAFANHVLRCRLWSSSGEHAHQQADMYRHAPEPARPVPSTSLPCTPRYLPLCVLSRTLSETCPPRGRACRDTSCGGVQARFRFLCAIGRIRGHVADLVQIQVGYLLTKQRERLGWVSTGGIVGAPRVL
jgi:hypothetical protein